MKPGYIYIMRDQIDCNIIKVGFTIDPINRLRQLYTTGTPLPYTISHLWGVEDMQLAEKAAHAALYDHRVNPAREFFFIVPINSDLEGSNCPDTCDIYLDALTEIIEELFLDLSVKFDRINFDSFRQKYEERLQLFPNGLRDF